MGLCQSYRLVEVERSLSLRLLDLTDSQRYGIMSRLQIGRSGKGHSDCLILQTFKGMGLCQGYIIDEVERSLSLRLLDLTDSQRYGIMSRLQIGRSGKVTEIT